MGWEVDIITVTVGNERCASLEGVGWTRPEKDGVKE